MKLQQHQEKSLVDWNERKTSLDARIKTMDKRTGQWPTIGNTMHEVESQNAIVKVRSVHMHKIIIPKVQRGTLTTDRYIQTTKR